MGCIRSVKKKVWNRVMIWQKTHERQLLSTRLIFVCFGIEIGWGINEANKRSQSSKNYRGWIKYKKLPQRLRENKLGKLSLWFRRRCSKVSLGK